MILREWINERMNGEDEITIELLVADAYRDLAHDEEFAEAMLADGLAMLVPTIARELWHQGREFVEVESGAVSRSSIEEKSSRFARWIEHVGEGRHKSLLACTKTEVGVAIEERRGQVKGQLRAIAFLSDIEGRLPTGGSKVGAKLKEVDLDRIWRAHFKTDQDD